MFSSYDEKRPTQAGKHKDLSVHMCEVWGKQAVLGLLGMRGKQTEKGYMAQGKMIVKSETLGQEASLKQHRWESQIQPKVPKTRMRFNRGFFMLIQCPPKNPVQMKKMPTREHDWTYTGTLYWKGCAKIL